MDGGLFGVDSVRDYFSHKISEAKGAAADFAADKITKEGTSLARRIGTQYLGEKAGKMSGDLAHEILAPRAKAQLRRLVGAGALGTVRSVLGEYRRWLAHGRRWDREKAARKRGQKTRPLDRGELKYHLALVGVERNWDREKWSRTAMQKGLNMRLRQLFSKRTKKNELLQLIDILDTWRKKNSRMKGKKSFATSIEEMEPQIQGKDYFDEYMPRRDMTDLARQTIDRPVRKKRKLSKYNQFMSVEISRQRQSNPRYDAKQAFSAAVKAWRDGGREGEAAAAAGRAGVVDHDQMFLDDIDDDLGGDSPPRRLKRGAKKKTKIRYPTLEQS
jgi:hypothetical protein